MSYPLGASAKDRWIWLNYQPYLRAGPLWTFLLHCMEISRDPQFLRVRRGEPPLQLPYWPSDSPGQLPAYDYWRRCFPVGWYWVHFEYLGEE